MKIVAINYSPSVGKTTTTVHLLYPRMPGAEFFSVETTNQSAGHFGIKVRNLRGQDFGQLYQELSLLDDAIIDVGASNAEWFLHTMTQARSSWRQFDLFLVPLIHANRTEKETIQTVDKLHALGVPRDRIKLVFNRAEVGGNIEADFAGILEYADQFKKCIADEHLKIEENELFDLLSTEKATLPQLSTDNIDYGAEAKKASKEGRKSEAAALVRRAWCIELGRGITPAFDALFNRLVA